MFQLLFLSHAKFSKSFITFVLGENRSVGRCFSKLQKHKNLLENVLKLLKKYQVSRTNAYIFNHFIIMYRSHPRLWLISIP